MRAKDRVRAILDGKDAGTPLFAPLACAVAATVEALDVRGFLRNTTKMTKGLQALSEAIESDAIVCCCPSAMEAEAVGAILDWSTYPPRVVDPPDLMFPRSGASSKWEELVEEGVERMLLKAPRIEAAIETIRRLGITKPGGRALIAALTGPATLAGQLVGASFWEGIDAEQGNCVAALEASGRIAIEFARLVSEAGADAVILVEERLPRAGGSGVEEWRSVVIPAAKVVRFYRVLPMVLVKELTDEHRSGWGDDPLDGALICLRDGRKEVGSMVRPYATALPVAASAWVLESDFDPGCFVTTAGEISPTEKIPDLRSASQKVRTALAAHTSGSSRNRVGGL